MAHRINMAKLEASLEYFDSEVKYRVAQMKEKINQRLKDVDYSYHLALIKLPKAVRQMPWMDYFTIVSEKPKSPEGDDIKREEEAAIVESVVAEDHAVLGKSVEKRDSNTQTNYFKKSKGPDYGDAEHLNQTIEQEDVGHSSQEYNGLFLDDGPHSPRYPAPRPKAPKDPPPQRGSTAFRSTAHRLPIAAGNEDIRESNQLVASQLDSLDLSMLQWNSEVALYF